MWLHDHCKSLSLIIDFLICTELFYYQTMHPLFTMYYTTGTSYGLHLMGHCSCFEQPESRSYKHITVYRISWTIRIRVNLWGQTGTELKNRQAKSNTTSTQYLCHGKWAGLIFQMQRPQQHQIIFVRSLSFREMLKISNPFCNNYSSLTVYL